MKKFLSLVLALVMTMSLVTVSAGAKTFEDDDKINYTEAVEVMKAIEVVDGYADGSFNPTNVLTRQAAAKIICNLVLGPTTADALVASENPYPDVPTTSQFAGYIAYCKQTGIISGYADGNFRPTGTLTGYAFMKMLLGALGYDQTVEGYVGENWKVNVAKRALALGLDDGLLEAFNGNKSVNREEACLYSLNMINNEMVVYGYKGVASASTQDQKTFMATYFKNLAKGGEETGVYNKNNVDVTKVLRKDDQWGRPSYAQYFLKNEKGKYEPIVFIPQAPVVSYNVATTECDICKDLGEKKEAKMAAVTLNGVDKDRVTLTALATKDKVGAQGQLVEIYDIASVDAKGVTTHTYEMVKIDTYLAQVEKVTEVKTDANGHIKTQASLKLDILSDYKDAKTDITLHSDKDYKYEEDEYVLVYVNYKDVEDSEILEVVTPVTQKIDGFSALKRDEIKLDGAWEKLALTNFIDTAIEGFAKADVIYDQYDNVIGVLKVDAEETTVVIDSMYTETTKGKSTFYAEVVTMDGEIEPYIVDKLFRGDLNGNGEIDANEVLDVDDVFEKNSVNKATYADCYDKLFTYTVNDDDEIVLTCIEDSIIGEDAETEVSAKWRLVDLYVQNEEGEYEPTSVRFNDETTFLIHENDGSYTSVKGDDIKDIDAAYAEIVGDDYAEIVYLYGDVMRDEDLQLVYVPIQDMGKIVEKKIETWDEKVPCVKIQYIDVDGNPGYGYLPVAAFYRPNEAITTLTMGGFFDKVRFEKDGSDIVLDPINYAGNGYYIDYVVDVKNNTVALKWNDPFSALKVENIYVIENNEITAGDPSDFKKDTYVHVFYSTNANNAPVIETVYIDKDLTDWVADYAEDHNMDEALTKAVEALEKAEEDVETAEGNVETATAEKTAADTAVTRAEGAVETAEEAVETAEAEKTAAEEAVTAAEEALAEAQAAYDEAVEAVNDAMDVKKDEKLDLDVAKGNLADAKTAVTEAEAALKAAEDALEALNQNPDATEEAKTEAEAAVTAAETKKADAETKLAEAQAAVDEAQADYDAADTALATATEAKTDAKTTLDDAKAAVKTAEAAVKTAEDALTAAQAALTEAQADLTEAEAEKTAAEAALKAAQDDLKAKQDALTAAEKAAEDLEKEHMDHLNKIIVLNYPLWDLWEEFPALCPCSLVFEIKG